MFKYSKLAFEAIKKSLSSARMNISQIPVKISKTLTH